MSWLPQAIANLSAATICGYLPGGEPASEPTALAALAMFGHGRRDEGRRAAVWLAELQSEDGSLGIGNGEPTPPWPTGLAVLAWSAAAQEGPDPACDWGTCLRRAADWAVGFRGKPLPNDPSLGHDASLAAWPWCAGTHAWVEPTAFFVLGLKAAGYGAHPRTREGVRMLFDRQLPTGGCNYGNTTVLGKMLRPHVQPTGIALLALAGEADPAWIARVSRRYLRGALSADTPTASLCWGLLGLAAQGESPPQAAEWLAAAYGRTREGDASPYKLALLALAALGERSPLIALTRGNDAS